MAVINRANEADLHMRLAVGVRYFADRWISSRLARALRPRRNARASDKTRFSFGCEGWRWLDVTVPGKTLAQATTHGSVLEREPQSRGTTPFLEMFGILLLLQAGISTEPSPDQRKAERPEKKIESSDGGSSLP